MIARDEARLRALFERLLLVSIVASPLGCSTPDDASGADASATIDASPNCNPVPLDAATDGSGCDFFVGLPCGLPPDSSTYNCYLELAQCAVLCNQTESLQRVCAVAECLDIDGGTVPSTGPLTLECATGAGACAPGAGRRPEGLVGTSPARRGDAVGSMLADFARLEAASVHAFRRLGSELASMRAPRSLVRAAARSARDEVRHARVMTRLARRHGAAPAPVGVRGARRTRSLEAFAIENGVEGCVRECFGALVATRQAARARDPEVARAMGRIARDETRHAALAWKVARWIEPRLGDAARARVRRAIDEALTALRCEVALTSAELALALGLPAGRDGAALVDAFEAALFRESRGHLD